MNPIKFLIEDFKKDIKTIGQIGHDLEHGMPEEKKKYFKKAFTEGWGTFLQDNWIFFLLLALAFTSGWFVAGKHYQNKCNEAIVKEFYPWLLNDSYERPFDQRKPNYALIDFNNLTSAPKNTKT